MRRLTQLGGRLAAMTLLLLATLFSGSSSAQSEYEPHHEYYTRSWDGCVIGVKHGNYLGAAYSKARQGGGFCSYGSSVQVIAGTSLLQGPVCPVFSGDCPITDWPNGPGYRQSALPGYNIVGTHLRVCGVNSCKTFNVSAVF
jgi:hypothetical protein